MAYWIGSDDHHAFNFSVTKWADRARKSLFVRKVNRTLKTLRFWPLKTPDYSSFESPQGDQIDLY